MTSSHEGVANASEASERSPYCLNCGSDIFDGSCSFCGLTPEDYSDDGDY